MVLTCSKANSVCPLLKKLWDKFVRLLIIIMKNDLAYYWFVTHVEVVAQRQDGGDRIDLNRKGNVSGLTCKGGDRIWDPVNFRINRSVQNEVHARSELWMNLNRGGQGWTVCWIIWKLFTYWIGRLVAYTTNSAYKIKYKNRQIKSSTDPDSKFDPLSNIIRQASHFRGF